MEATSTNHEDKLYLVTHAELSTGYQIAQIAHATADFMLAHPATAQNWSQISNSIIALEAANAEHLSNLLEQAQALNLTTIEFREPDMGDEITAIAFAPSLDTPNLLANLPCAGRTPRDEKLARKRETKLRKLSSKMEDCPQTEGQNVLQHGRSVREHYFALLDHINGKTSLHNTSNWRIPEWVDANRELIQANLLPRFVMDRYLTLHDCGKPRVRYVDEDGKQHFPNHAESSEQVYLSTFKDSASDTVAYLIRHDMDAHLLKNDGVEEFSKQPTAVCQLLAALAEVTSNAAMFGGIESTSFKIKFKQINQRGKAVLNQIAKENK